ncbi:Rv0361 family membrane protein [Salinispora vitiensis]|uniref:Rv0361 family membrane protein n=1 Tax=Salinispora vitiensis TaxID=999544 RepID=UPI0003A43211|nr:hypothetical protein [Salinispora vitiensis]
MSQSASDDPTHQPDHPTAPAAPPAPPNPSAYPPPDAPDAPPNPSAYPAPPAPYPPEQQSPAPRRRRGFLIASIALAVTLVLCVGGGVAAFLVLRPMEEGPGAEEPRVAVDEFLTAVYQDRDAAQASSLVCSAARDRDKISAKVAEVEKYAADYEKPHFRWSPPKVEKQTKGEASVTTTVTMTTADEHAAELPLRLTVIWTEGWRVCEVAGG